MLLHLVDPFQLVAHSVVLASLVMIALFLRTAALRVRDHARRNTHRARLLNDVPAELRWRVFERDRFTCQQCGTESDLLVDFRNEPPADGPVRLEQLVVRCVRCGAISRQSDTID